MTDEQRNRYQRTMERARFIEDRTGIDIKMEWECEIDNNPIFDKRQPNMYRYYCWKKAKDRKATTINAKLLLKVVEERIFFGMLEVDIEVPPHLMDHYEILHSVCHMLYTYRSYWGHNAAVY